MQFNSYSYLALLLFAVAGFWALPPRVRRWYVLTLSIAFYATWGPVFVLVPIALCAGVFVMARKIAAEPERGSWYWTAIAYALAFLVVFRYHQGIGNVLIALEEGFRISPGRTLLHVAVPLGISSLRLASRGLAIP